MRLNSEVSVGMTVSEKLKNDPNLLKIAISELERNLRRTYGEIGATDVRLTKNPIPNVYRRRIFGLPIGRKTTTTTWTLTVSTFIPFDATRIVEPVWTTDQDDE